MDEHDLGHGPIGRVEALAGGTQNVMLGFERAGRGYVLRRGPRHLRPRSNDVMRREARVLAALAGSEVPHPRFVAGCFDESVMDGAVFYLMEPVHGFNATTGLPGRFATDASWRHAMGLEAAAALATLGRVDHQAVGLADLGKPDGFLERQVPRWMGELEGYAKLENYPGPEIPDLERIAAWLERNRPARFTPGILHGDYHLANVMFAYDAPRLVAIVDWEMCTIGDPLLDLGWFVASFPSAKAKGPTPVAGLAGVEGLPSPAELVARYAEGSSRDLSCLVWYEVLACFKLGIVLEGTHARACAGKAPRETGDLLHAITLGLFEQARSLIAGG
ncbi:MAG TPA: phosphotransferase family protein [Myxococcota bacterium]|nr:phosphotransferase family protein [Myxococcota bacterium]